MADLTVGLAKVEGPKIDAFKHLALVFAHYSRQDFVELEKSLASGLRAQNLTSAEGKLYSVELIGDPKAGHVETKKKEDPE